MVCHYCGSDAGGTTRDHIVPKAILRASGLSGVVINGVSNVVYACYKCNQRKGNKKSTCPCRRCALAWATYGQSAGVTVEIIDMTLRLIKNQMNEQKG
jgi:hypothetical protein